MADQPYPSTLAEIDSWSQHNGVSTLEAQIRFMGFVILNCVASDPVTRRGMVLKGGNALRFAYQSPRSTKDLDFSVCDEGIPDEANTIRDLLNGALTFGERRFNVKAKCQRVKRNPKSSAATRPTYNVAVGYQFPTDRYFHNFKDRDFSTVIPLEITLNDLVCDTTEWADVQGLQVCSLDDIVAEKLRSLLQQRIRNRNRPQRTLTGICTANE